MNANKDYYAILGVLPTAEDVVIRAAYKALAQRYHPDRYSGSAEEATRIMKNINRAYQVLSDPRKRKEYDSQRNRNKNNSYEPDEEEQYEEYAGTDPLDDQWKMAVDYYPDLVAIDKRLHNISSKLSYTFRAYLLSEKEFEQRAEIANVMENTFLETYFGSNEKIIKFAKKLILDGKKEAARELNKTIKVLGKDANAQLVIERISDIYYPKQNVSSSYVNPKANYHGYFKMILMFLSIGVIMYVLIILSAVIFGIAH